MQESHAATGTNYRRLLMESGGNVRILSGSSEGLRRSWANLPCAPLIGSPHWIYRRRTPALPIRPVGRSRSKAKSADFTMRHRNLARRSNQAITIDRRFIQLMPPACHFFYLNANKIAKYNKSTIVSTDFGVWSCRPSRVERFSRMRTTRCQIALRKSP
jgi:hypothetical protein